MKSLLLGVVAPFLIANSNAYIDKQFPLDDKVYRPKVDTGFEQYKTSSMKRTKKIVLTFDDGPHITRTPKVLDLLKKYNAKATFFVLTRNINAKTLPIAQRILREGHILASHDHDHDTNNKETENEYGSELKESIQTIKMVEASTGIIQNNAYYRFPYGAYGRAAMYHHLNTMKDVSRDLFDDNCINFAFWDIDSGDWLAQLSPEQIASNVMAHIVGGTAYKHKKVRSLFGKTKFKVVDYEIRTPRGGGVALLHDIHDRSIKATEILLKKLKKHRVQIVPLSSVDEYSYRSKDCRELY